VFHTHPFLQGPCSDGAAPVADPPAPTADGPAPSADLPSPPAGVSVLIGEVGRAGLRLRPLRLAAGDGDGSGLLSRWERLVQRVLLLDNGLRVSRRCSPLLWFLLAISAA